MGESRERAREFALEMLEMFEHFVTLFVAEPKEVSSASSTIDDQSSITADEEGIDLMDRLTRIKSIIKNSVVRDPTSPVPSTQATAGASSSASIKGSFPSDPHTVTDLNNWRDPTKSFTTASPEKPSRNSPATIASSMDFPHLPSLVVQGSPRALSQARTSLARFSKLQPKVVSLPDPVIKEPAESDSNGSSRWISPHLSSHVQDQLRQVMATPPSNTELGSVYAIEVTGHDITGYSLISLGYTKNVLQTMGRWDKAHQSNRAQLRAIWPGNVIGAATFSDTIKLKEYLRSNTQRVKYYQRLAKLIDIELSDYKYSARCNYCIAKSKHVGLFTFPHGGISTWEEIVVPVVQKWRKYVEECM